MNRTIKFLGNGQLILLACVVLYQLIERYLTR
jgi:hypothetical protein